MVNRDTIPAELQAIDQWVCWRTEYRDDADKPTKTPIIPGTRDYASVADPATWQDFATAYQSYQESTNVDGIGFVFTTDDPYVGIDLDDCRDPIGETLEAWAGDIIYRLDSYTEISPSGTGLHSIVAGELPDDGNRNGDIELYDQDRYFTVTGDHYPNTPKTVHDRTDQLAAVHAEYIIETDTESAIDRDEPLPSETTQSSAKLSDDELLERAFAASNGDKFERLWNGDTSGYPSHSEADQALCNMLAFWTGGDLQQIERLFSRSGLAREKWYGREDYRERTIRKAIRDCPAYYTLDSD